MKKTRLIKFTILLLACFTFVSCEPEEEKPGSIFGMVSDFSTNEPVKGANVQLRPGGETTLTGADGMYEFSEVPMGEYSIMVSKAEYTDLVDDYVIEVKEGKQMRRDVQIKKRPLALHLYDNDSNEISELDFGDDEGVTQKTFNIFNGGTQKIDYTIRKTVDWITEVSDPSGTINTGVTKPIVVTIDRRKLAVGDNNTILTITASEGGGRELAVKAKNIIKTPTVNILDAIAIDSVTYRIKCEVTSDGGLTVTGRGICWNTYGDPTMEDDTIPFASGGTGQYTIRMERLNMATHYYVKAYAKNKLGTSLSEVVDFVTGEIVTAPTVATVEVKDVTATSAVCRGNVTDDGGTDIIERGVCWGSAANPTVNGQHQAASSASVGEFSVSITGLTSNTTYHVRAYAKNSRGISYGRDLTFVTIEGQPVVTTASVTNITATSAQSGGTVTSQGASAVTERGVCWSTSQYPTLDNDHASSGTGTGSYTVSLTNLAPETKYYVRAYVINAQSTAYGDQKEFTTTPRPTFTVSILANPTTGGTVTGGGSYQEGQSCTVTASSNAGFVFVKWTENGNQVSTDASYTFTVIGNRTLVAQFDVVNYTISTSSNPADGGVTSGSGSYQEGRQCTVTAIASTGYDFTEWTENGASVSANASYTFTVTGDRALVANFTPKTYTIIVTASPSNGGAVSGGGSYSYGQICTVTATPVSGYSFLRWIEGGVSVSSTSTFTFTVTNDRNLEANFMDIHVGTIDGLFSVNQYNKQVYFSQGNLQYVGSSNTWQFADNQWDMIGESQSNYLQGTTRDLFAWGTSGYSHGAVCFHPWDFTLYESDYWAYGNAGMDLNDGNGRADWGYNAISNGGNMENSGWRTLTGDEWNYVFNTRTTTSGIRYAKACVNDVNGVILLPDNWNTSIYVLNSINTANANFNTNVINASEWETLFEGNGAVFLPAAGQFFNGNAGGNNFGSYWSASHFGNTKACNIYFTNSDLKYYYYHRPYGFSVRLVRNAQ